MLPGGGGGTNTSSRRRSARGEKDTGATATAPVQVEDMPRLLIPLEFVVFSRGSAVDVSDMQLQDQVAVLNAAYGGTSDARAADARIAFTLDKVQVCAPS